MNTYKLIKLCTNHVSQSTSEWLDGQGKAAASTGQYAAAPIASTDDGWYVSCAHLHEYENVPQDLLEVASWCAVYGVAYILFDASEETVDDLPVFEW